MKRRVLERAHQAAAVGEARARTGTVADGDKSMAMWMCGTANPFARAIRGERTAATCRSSRDDAHCSDVDEVLAGPWCHEQHSQSS